MARLRYTYEAFLRDDGGWTATCSDFPDIMAHAGTREGALRSLEEGVELALRELREAGRTPPPPSPRPRYAGQGGRRRGKAG